MRGGRRWAGARTCGVKGGTNIALHASLKSCLRGSCSGAKTLLKNPKT